MQERCESSSASRFDLNLILLSSNAKRFSKNLDASHCMELSIIYFYHLISPFILKVIYRIGIHVDSYMAGSPVCPPLVLSVVLHLFFQIISGLSDSSKLLCYLKSLGVLEHIFMIMVIVVT